MVGTEWPKLSGTGLLHLTETPGFCLSPSLSCDLGPDSLPAVITVGFYSLPPIVGNCFFLLGLRFSQQELAAT